MTHSVNIQCVNESDLNDELISTVKKLMGKSEISKHRMMDYVASRTAIKCALSSLGYNKQLNELEILNYHCLKQLPQFLVSISHSRGIGAAIIADKKDYLSVGIDIEFADRSLPDKSEKYYFNESDSICKSIQLWSIKEACFKAYNSYQLIHKKPFIQMAQFSVDEKYIFLTDQTQPIGEYSLSIQNITNRDLIIATALLYQTVAP